jgi:hypothetical protein
MCISPDPLSPPPRCGETWLFIGSHLPCINEVPPVPASGRMWFANKGRPDSITVASKVIGVVNETADLDRYVVCVLDVHFLPTTDDDTYPFLISEELKNCCTASCTPQVAGDQLVILHYPSSHARARHLLSSPKARHPGRTVSSAFIFVHQPLVKGPLLRTDRNHGFRNPRRSSHGGCARNGTMKFIRICSMLTHRLLGTSPPTKRSL